MGVVYKLKMASGSVHIRKEVLDDISWLINVICYIHSFIINGYYSRFIINLPEEEKIDIMKVCDHLETAYWFYLDFLRPDDHTLPACNFEEFLTTSYYIDTTIYMFIIIILFPAVFRHCSVRIPDGLTTETLVTQWKNRKYKKPVRGAIILNNDYTKVRDILYYTILYILLLVIIILVSTSTRLSSVIFMGVPQGKDERRRKKC